MANDIPSVGLSYAQFILAKWEDIVLLREEFLQNYMNDVDDSAAAKDYISRMISMWQELHPKIKNRTDLDPDIIRKFDMFSTYCFDPKGIYKDKDPTLIIQLDQILREAVEKLKVTNFE